MDDTNAVEDDGQMSERMLLEERAVLVDAVETNGTLCRRNVDKTTLTRKVNTNRSIYTRTTGLHSRDRDRDHALVARICHQLTHSLDHK